MSSPPPPRPLRDSCARSPAGRSWPSRSTASSEAASIWSCPSRGAASRTLERLGDPGGRPGRSADRPLLRGGREPLRPARRRVPLCARRVRQLRRLPGRLDELARPRRRRREPHGLFRARSRVLLAGRGPRAGTGFDDPRAARPDDVDQRRRRQARSADDRRPHDRKAHSSSRPRFAGPLACPGTASFPCPLPEARNFGPAALLVLYAYSGFEAISAPAGEFQDPQAQSAVSR